MFALIAALGAALTVWLWKPPRTPATRLTSLMEAATQKRPPGDSWSTNPPTNGTLHRLPAPSGATPPANPWPAPRPTLARRPAPATILAALCAGTTVSFMTALPVGAAAALATAWFLHTREDPQLKKDRDRITDDLPFAADLMVACLQAGQPVSAATDAAAQAVSGPWAPA